MLETESDFTSLTAEPAVTQPFRERRGFENIAHYPGALGNISETSTICSTAVFVTLLGHPPHSRILALHKDGGVGPPRELGVARLPEAQEP